MNVHPLPAPLAHLFAFGLKTVHVCSHGVLHRGELAIAAVPSDARPSNGIAELLQSAGVEAVDRLPTGIVCMVELIDCEPIPCRDELPNWLGTTFPPREASLDDFTRGGYAWHMLLLERLATPIPWRPRPETFPGKPKATRSTTRAAYEAIQTRLNGLQQLVLDAIDAGGTKGATRDEVSVILGRAANAITPRVKELLDAGLVLVTKQRRPTRAGHTAEVLVTMRHARRASHR